MADNSVFTAKTTAGAGTTVTVNGPATIHVSGTWGPSVVVQVLGCRQGDTPVALKDKNLIFTQNSPPSKNITFYGDLTLSIEDSGGDTYSLTGSITTAD